MVEKYLQAFVNFEQNNCVKLLPIAKFAFNNTLNTNNGYNPHAKPRYHLWVFNEESTNLRFKSQIANKLSAKLKKLMIIFAKTSTMPKNFKIMPIIKASSLEKYF